MGAFEDFVNSNLGIRQPFISDFSPPTGVNKSTKAAGIRGSKFLDLSTNFLYEKTGENNDTDWSKIAELGEPRGGSLTNLYGDQHVQFVSGSSLIGSPNFIYDYQQEMVSGVSGYYQDIDGISGHLTDELIIGEPENGNFVEIDDGSVNIYGSLNVEKSATISGSLNNRFVPKYGIDFTLSNSPTIRGSSTLRVTKISNGFYRISNFPAFNSIDDYQVIASVCNVSDFTQLQVNKSVNNIDLHLNLSDGTEVDAGIVTLFIYEF